MQMRRAGWMLVVGAVLAAYLLGQRVGVAEARPAPVVTQVPVGQKVVALTFDDGPTARWTPKILAILKAAGIRATFFVIGQQATRYPYLIAEEVHMGMEVGNHGQNHRRLTGISAAAMRQEVDAGAASIMAAGAPRPRLYRMPAGVYSQTALSILGQLGYTVIGWSVDPQDWRHRWSAEQMLAIVERQVTPGAIIIFHDGTNGSAATVETVRLVIAQLKRQGYRFVTVGQLLKMAGTRSAVPGGRL
jgi:peptidoglycan/xylan/chitin deacetylase (PgdA/CDA1 family)